MHICNTPCRPACCTRWLRDHLRPDPGHSRTACRRGQGPRLRCYRELAPAPAPELRWSLPARHPRVANPVGRCSAFYENVDPYLARTGEKSHSRPAIIPTRNSKSSPLVTRGRIDRSKPSKRSAKKSASSTTRSSFTAHCTAGCSVHLPPRRTNSAFHRSRDRSDALLTRVHSKPHHQARRPPPRLELLQAPVAAARVAVVVGIRRSGRRRGLVQRHYTRPRQHRLLIGPPVIVTCGLRPTLRALPCSRDPGHALDPKLWATRSCARLRLPQLPCHSPASPDGECVDSHVCVVSYRAHRRPASRVHRRPRLHAMPRTASIPHRHAQRGRHHF